MRTDKDFMTMHQKEQTVTDWLLDNSCLSSWTKVTDPVMQCKGVDLSCMTRDGRAAYVDLKLKNSTSLNEPSQFWSVEILKLDDYGNQQDGWFVKSDEMTNIYMFLDAYGKDWNSIRRVDNTIFSKKKMADLILDITGLLPKNIHSDAIQLMYDDFSFKKSYRRFWLKKSSPDNGRPVVNLCFHRDILENIQAIRQTYTTYTSII